MAIRTINLYFDMSNGSAFLSPSSSVSENNRPTMFFSEKVLVNLQYLNSNAVTNGEFSDFYTDFSGSSIASSVAIDNNYVFFNSTTLATALTAATPVGTVTVSAPASAPRRVGALKLTNASGDTETVYFNAFVVNIDGTYTFTTSDTSYVTTAYTPTYDFPTAGTTVLVKEPPLVKSVEIDYTDQATGLFVVTLDANTITLFDAISGTGTLGTDVKFEHQVFVNGATYPSFVSQCPFTFTNIIDYDNAIPPAPASDFYNRAQLLSLLTPYSKSFAPYDTDASLAWDGDIATLVHSLGTTTPTVTVYIDGVISTVVVAAPFGGDAVSLDFGNLGTPLSFGTATVKVSKY